MTAWLTWDASPAAWAVAAAVAVAGAVALRHYGRSGGFALAGGLRGAVLTLLAVTALRPTVRYVEAASAARPLRVVLDDSASMATADPRTAGEWLRVAEVTGEYAAADARPARDAEHARAAVEAWRQATQRMNPQRQNDAPDAADRARLEQARDRATRAIRALASAARDAGAADVALAIGRANLDRADPVAAARTLDELMPLIRRASDDADEQLATNDETAIDAVDRLDGTSRFDLAVAAARRLQSSGAVNAALLDGTRIDLATAARTGPSAPATPLTAALRDACGRAAAAGDEAVVLLSDGRSTEPRSLLAQAAAANVAVYTVAVAPDDRSPDVRVLRIESPAAVLAGQDVPLRVRLTQQNLEGQTARLRITDGRRDVVRAVPAGGDVAVSLTWPAAVGPRLTLTAGVEAVAGERRLANNTLTADVGVIARAARVLLLTGPPSRDAEDLAAAVSDAPWATLRRVELAAGRPAALRAQDLADADVIVLTDVPAGALDDAAWSALGRAVRQGGASLLVLAGRGDWLADASTATRLAPLLPTAPGPRPAWVTPRQPVWPVPTRAGADAAYLRTEESADASQRAWLGRPRLSRVLAMGPPLARARTLLADRVTQSPVLLDAAVGGGRCAAVLVDEAWRWSTAADSPDATRRFWLGLMQSLVDLPYAVGGDGLQISIDRVAPTAGRTFFARVRAADPAAGAVTITLTRAGVALGPPPLRETLPGGGRFAAPLNLAAGVYELMVRQAGNALRAGVTVGEEPPAELIDTSPDNAHLKRIAEATGGTAIMLDELGRLPDLLALRRDREPRTGTYALWSSGWWFLTIVGCLGLEWAVRPRAGLA